MEIEKYITAERAMRLLNCSRGILNNYVTRGHIKRMGERYGARFSEADVLKVCEMREKRKIQPRKTEKKPKLGADSGIELQRLINKQILRNRRNGRKH